jgi:iron complex outermembrane receptor protein
VSQLNNVDGSLVIFTNTYPAVIEGWENNFHFRLTRADDFDLGLIVLRSHYKELLTYLPSDTAPIGAPINLAGRSLDMTPTLAATLGYTHTFALKDGASLKLHLYSKYSSSYYETNIGPFISYTQPSFTRSNADLRYSFRDDKAYVGLFITNIEDKLQITAAPSLPAPVPNGQTVSATDPRTFGVTLGMRF